MLKKKFSNKSNLHLARFIGGTFILTGVAYAGEQVEPNTNREGLKCTPIQLDAKKSNKSQSSDSVTEQEGATLTWEASLYKHPLAEAVSKGITINDIENGLVGYEDFVSVDECGQVNKGSRAVLIKPTIVKADTAKKKDKLKKVISKGVRIDKLLFEPRQLSDKTASNVSTPAVLTFTRPALPNVQQEIEKAVLEGRIITNGDKKDVHQAILVKRKAILQKYLQDKVKQIKQAGYKVISSAKNSAVVEVQLSRNQVNSLQRLTDKQTVTSDKVALIPTASGHAILSIIGLKSVSRIVKTTSESLDGETVHQGTQIDHYLTRGDQGFARSGYKANNGSRLNAAIIEVGGGLDANDHVGFRRTASGASSIENQYTCDANGCTTSENIGSATGHSLRVTGVIAGDLTEGQDSTISDALERRQRSGTAQESTFDFFFSSGGRFGLDHVADNGADYWLVNNSWGGGSTCASDSTTDLAANAAFEAGVAVFKSAGNNGNSTSNCTTSDPGTAIGVFTVGGHTNSTDIASGDVDDTRNGSIYTSSSRGGDDSGRTAIDITAPACRQNLYDDAGGYGGSRCGTSYAAPTVAGASLDFINWWQDAGYSTAIESPGTLYTNLLLMGDGQRESTSSSNKYLEAKFDELWGAGRFKARAFDAKGLDAPYSWGSGSTCVGNAENVYVDINSGNAISSDVEVLKAVIWWYDRRHEDGTDIDDIDLRLEQKLSGSSTYGSVRSSADSNDNKERVVWHDLNGSDSYRLRINGYDVTADNEGCGTDKMKVYYAYYYEDSDRDDSDGPAWNSSTKIGVEPQAKD